MDIFVDGVEVKAPQKNLIIVPESRREASEKRIAANAEAAIHIAVKAVGEATTFESERAIAMIASQLVGAIFYKLEEGR